VKSKEEAIEWVKRIPNPHGEGEETEVEVRQVFDEADFGPELVAQVPEVFDAERKFREAEDARREERQRQATKQ
jgi:hypothetical protein